MKNQTIKNNEFKISIFILLLSIAFICYVFFYLSFQIEGNIERKILIQYAYECLIATILYFFIYSIFIPKITYITTLNYPLFAFNLHLGLFASAVCVSIADNNDAVGWMAMLYFPVFLLIVIGSLIWGIRNDVKNYKKRKKNIN